MWGGIVSFVQKWEVSENKNQFSWKSGKHRLGLQSALKRNEMYQQVLGSFRNLQTWKFELWEAPKSSIFLSVLWFFLPWGVENGGSPEWLVSWVSVCSWQGHSCVKDLQILRPMKNGTVLIQTGSWQSLYWGIECWYYVQNVSTIAFSP